MTKDRDLDLNPCAHRLGTGHRVARDRRAHREVGQRSLRCTSSQAHVLVLAPVTRQGKGSAVVLVADRRFNHAVQYST